MKVQCHAGFIAGDKNCNYCIQQKRCESFKIAKKLAEREEERNMRSNDPNKVQVDWTKVKNQNILPLTSCDIPMPAVKPPKKKMQDIYYIVRLKEQYRQELNLTTITKDFCGKIVNQTAGNIYFELNGSDALVIIPHSWIEWLAPSKKLWNRDKGEI